MRVLFSVFTVDFPDPVSYFEPFALVRYSKQTITKDLHLSWTLQRSGEICEKCASLRWSSCDAGRSAVAGSAPGRVPNQRRFQSLWISRCEWNFSSRWSVRRRVQTPCHSPPCIYPRPLTHSGARAFFFLWGRPRPRGHGTGNGKMRKYEKNVSHFMPKWIESLVQLHENISQCIPNNVTAITWQSAFCFFVFSLFLHSLSRINTGFLINQLIIYLIAPWSHIHQSEN